MIVVALFFALKAIVKTLREKSFGDFLLRVQQPAGYIVGVLAMFWTFDRLAGFWV